MATDLSKYKKTTTNKKVDLSKYKVKTPEELSTIRVGNVPVVGGAVGRSIQRTGQRFKETTEAQRSGEQTLPESLLQYGGAIIGGALQPVAEGALGLAGAITPQFVKENLKTGYEQSALPKIVDPLVKGYSNLSPRTKRNLEAGLDISSVIPVGAGIKATQTVLPKLTKAVTTKTDDVLRGFSLNADTVIKNQFDDFVKGNKSLQNNLNKFEKQRNVPLRENLTDDYIFRGIKVDKGKVDAKLASNRVENRIDIALDAKREILRELDNKIVPVNREVFRQNAFKAINASQDFTPANKAKIINAVNKQIDALPEEMTLSQADEFRSVFRKEARNAQQLQKRNSEYTILENTFRDTVFDVTDNLPFDTSGQYAQLNKYIKDQIATKEFIEKNLQGQTVKGGRLGRYVGRSIGAIAGSKGGILTTILGAEVGDTVAKILMNNQLGSSIKLRMVREITDNPTILKLADDMLKNAQQYNPVDTPAIGSGAIRLPAPVRDSGVQVISAQKGPVTVNPQTGRFQTTYQSSIPNISRQNTANNITNTVPNGIIPTNPTQDTGVVNKVINRIKDTPNKQGGFVKIPLAKKEPQLPTKSKSLSLPNNTTNLATEAKKYKTADEFVNGQTYAGKGNIPLGGISIKSKDYDSFIKEIIEKESLSLEKRANGSIKLTFPYGDINQTKIQGKLNWHSIFPDKKAVEIATNADGSNVVFADVKNIKPEELNEFLAKISPENSVVYLFDKGKVNKFEIKTKSQLKQIWEEVNKKGVELPKNTTDLQTKTPVILKDIQGNKIDVPKGTVIKSGEQGANFVVEINGDTHLINKGQYQNLKGQSKVAEAKEFAPELKDTVETIRGDVKVDIQFDTARKVGNNKVYDSGNSDFTIIDYGKESLLSKAGEEVGWFKTPGEAMNAANGNLKKFGGSTKYSQYTLPDGKNYREILIQAPVEMGKFTTELPKGFSVKPFKPEWADQQLFAIYNKNGGIAKSSETFTTPEKAVKGFLDTTNTNFPPEPKNTFKSSHWEEPNVISHLRMNDRTYNGKKVSFMEELQSDWARDLRSKEQAAKDTGIPFKEGELVSHPLVVGNKWQEPTIKRALKDAVDSNAEYFAWINGEQTSARYNLATQVSEVMWKNDRSGAKSIFLDAKEGRAVNFTVDKNGRVSETAKSVPSDWHGKKLDEVLGKGLADKIMEKPTGTLSGDGLSFGGEWAHNLYDRQVKNIVEDLTGAKVEKLDLGLPVGTKQKQFVSEEFGTKLTPEQIKIEGVGLEIRPMEGGKTHIVTDILEGGKFKAVEKDFHDSMRGRWLEMEGDKNWLDRVNNNAEVFDLSPPKTTQQGIKLTPEIKAIIRGEKPQFKPPLKRTIEDIDISIPLIFLLLGGGLAIEQ